MTRGVLCRLKEDVLDLQPAGVVLLIGTNDLGLGGNPEDAAENELSLREGFRLLSAYRDRNGTKFWIITEADRSVTTLLLPEEY